MKLFATLSLAAGLLAAPIAPPVQDQKVDYPALKKMIEGLGYTTKELGTDGNSKCEFVTKTDDFTIPMAAEVSPSKNYVWLTVSLGEAPKAQAYELLKQNAKIQPNFFYVTSKDALMMGLPIDNRGIDATVLRRVIDKLGDDVTNSSSVWNAD